jgi:hypothetical protein
MFVLVGAVGFEPTNPSLVSKVRSVAGGGWKWPDVLSSCGDHDCEWPGVSWRLQSLALTLALGILLPDTIARWSSAAAGP